MSARLQVHRLISSYYLDLCSHVKLYSLNISLDVTSPTQDGHMKRDDRHDEVTGRKKKSHVLSVKSSKRLEVACRQT